MCAIHWGFAEVTNTIWSVGCCLLLPIFKREWNRGEERLFVRDCFVLRVLIAAYGAGVTGRIVMK